MQNRKKKKALQTWKDRMNNCIASNDSWDDEMCANYIKSSLQGCIRRYVDNLKTSISEQSMAKVTSLQEEWNTGKQVDGYVKIIEDEFVGYNHLTIDAENDITRIHMSQLTICNLSKLIPFASNFEDLFYKIGDDSDEMKNEFFRELPIISKILLDEYYAWGDPKNENFFR